LTTKKIRLILGIANKRVNKLCCINRICVSTYSDKKAHFSSMQFVAGRYQNPVMLFVCNSSIFS